MVLVTIMVYLTVQVVVSVMIRVALTTPIYQSNMQLRKDAKELCKLLEKNGYYDYEYDDNHITIKFKGVLYTPKTFDELENKLLKW